ncbi:ADP-ribosylglycohydrolase family protein [Bacillota bacterium LX-D]|nr:ADP-ribosylglycohydrolase family protein [Bacillota bacterium LX-D]
MLGAIIGDIVGSVFEFNNIKVKTFDLFSPKSTFTDDTVLIVATMDALLNNKPFLVAYKEWFRKYPNSGYGRSFLEWANSANNEPYNSWGNGSAMRVSPIGVYLNSVEEVLEKSKESAAVTHNHIEGIKGAQATASAVFLARSAKTKIEIKNYIEEKFKYNLNESIESIRTWYTYDVSCQGSVPQAIIAFLESNNFEDAIRNAISIGGDSDTIACITGAIAEAYYKNIPETIMAEAFNRLDDEMLLLVNRFYKNLG